MPKASQSARSGRWSPKEGTVPSSPLYQPARRSARSLTGVSRRPVRGPVSACWTSTPSSGSLPPIGSPPRLRRAVMPPSPFQALLGEDFAVLPESVRRLHGLAADVVTEGKADITSPRGFLPWLICWVSGLPAPGRNVPVTVAFQVD